MDMMESRESEERERDPPIEPRANLSQIIETFRNELNSCLMRSDYEMASQFQNCIMMILDAMDGPIPMPNARRVELFTTLSSCLESMADQVRIPSIQLWQTDTIAMVDRCAKWRTWTENLHVFLE